MENIICDTNIWYDIANGCIKIGEFQQLKLIGTAVNVIEIASTPNLVKNIELVRQAINVFQKHHFIIISSNPFDHLISIFDNSFEPNDDHVLELLNAFEVFDKIDTFDGLTPDDWNVIKGKIAKTVSNKEYITKVVNEVLYKSQTFIKTNHLKKTYSSKSYMDSWKHFFIFLISEYHKYKYKKKIIINENDPQWKRLEFFITAWDEYFKHLDIQPGRKFKNNDWFDLLNLVYVQPEFKYWTSEKRSWSKILKEKKELQPYVFEIK